MSFSNKPELNEEIRDRLATPEIVISQGLSDSPLQKIDIPTGLASGDLLDLTKSSLGGATAKPEDLSEELKEPKNLVEPLDEICRPLNLGFLRGYWIAVASGGFSAVGLIFFCISYPALCWYLPVFIFASLLLLGWAYSHIRWSKRAAVAVRRGIYSWADVAILREPEEIDERLHLHVLIDKTLLLPVANMDNGFDQQLLIEIIRQPAAKRKVFYLPGSNLPVVVATESDYLLLGQYGGPFWLRHAVLLTLILLGAQCLLYWFMSNIFNFFAFRDLFHS